MDATQELQQLRRFRKAMPPLPTPKLLYNKIIHECTQLKITIYSISDLFNDIKALRTSSEPTSARLTLLQTIEAKASNLQMQLALTRTQLRTLFTVPPLLIAEDVIKQKEWDALMHKPQFDHHGKPLLLDHEKIEDVITDQFNILKEYDGMLSQTRDNLLGEDLQQTKSFQQEVLAKLNDLTQVVNDGFSNASQSAHNAKLEEEITKIRATISTLEKNVDTLPEQIKDAIEQAILKISTLPPSAISGKSNNLNGARHQRQEDYDCDMSNNSEQSLSDSEDGEEVEVIMQNADYLEHIDCEYEDESNDQVQQVAMQRSQRRNKLREEIQQAKQGIRNLEEIISELEWEPKCEPRNYQRGTIRRLDGINIRCVYCERMGDHYSDSCVIFTDIADRKRIIHEKRRCECCLDVMYLPHNCRKRGAPCHYCKESGHHSSLCTLPEKSVEITDRLNGALHARIMARLKIEELEMELQQL